MARFFGKKYITHAENHEQLQTVVKQERLRADVAEANGDKVGEAVHTYVADTVERAAKRVETKRDGYRKTSESFLGTPVVGELAYQHLPANAPAASEVHSMATKVGRDIADQQTLESKSRIANKDGELQGTVTPDTLAAAEPSDNSKSPLS